MKKIIFSGIFIILLLLSCPNPGDVDVNLNLSNTPSPVTDSTSINIIVASETAVAYKYRLDTGDWGPEKEIRYPIIEENLGEGDHTLWVIGKSSGGMWQDESAAIVFSWRIDLLPAVMLSNLPADLTNSDSVNINISGNITSYRYKLDNSEYFPEQNISKPIFLSGLADGEHNLQVIGKDLEGNWMDAGEAVVFTWIIDTIAPVIELSNLPFAITQVTYIDIMVANPDEVVAFRYQLNGNSLSDEITADTHIKRTEMTEGDYSLTIVGKDEAGNWQSTDNATVYNWTINTSAPVIPLVNAPAVLTNNTSIDVSVGGADNVSYRYRINYGDWCDETPIDTHIVETNLPEGPNFLSVVAKDNTGTWQTEIVYEWVIDITPPDVDAGIDIGWTNQPSVLSGVVSDLHGWSCQWNKISGTGTVILDDDTRAVTNIRGISGEEAGFILQLTAVDAAGNSGEDTVTFNWDYKSPVIDAGNDIGAKCIPFALQPSVDDISPLTFLWEQAGGAGVVTFNDNTLENAHANGPPGCDVLYTLLLTVIDAGGNFAQDTLQFNWDDISPDPVSSFNVVAYGLQTDLTWSNPPEDYSGTLIIHSRSPITEIPAEGTVYSTGDTIGEAMVVLSGSTTSTYDIDAVPGTYYYYRAFAFDSAYNYSTAIGYEIMNPEAVAYVSADGSDNNTGVVPHSPLASIQAGIFRISNSGFEGEVHVSAGTYSENIILEEGVSLYGSYASDWADRNNKDRSNPVYRTEIVAYNTTPVLIAQDISGEIIIDGFVINDVENNTAAVFNDNSSPRITNNTLTGLFGISNQYNSSPLIAYNIIVGGDGPVSCGISNEDSSSPTIYNNSISGGLGNPVSFGILCKNKSVPTVRNNTIDGGYGENSSYGIYLDGSPGIVLENNIIFTSAGIFRYGIYEFHEDTPEVISNNNIFDCKVLYHVDDGFDIRTIFKLNALDNPDYANNISVDPDFEDREAGNYRLTIDTGVDVRAGGMDLSDFYTDDITGAGRTHSYRGSGFIDPSIQNADGWSLGAYEWD